MKKTTEIFESFYGTKNYFPFNDNYAYTDGMKWLRSKIGEDNFVYLLNNIVKYTSYRNIFTAAKMEIKDGKGYVKITDGNDNVIVQIILPEIIKYMHDGKYMMFCYHYVIMAASEY